MPDPAACCGTVAHGGMGTGWDRDYEGGATIVTCATPVFIPLCAGGRAFSGWLVVWVVDGESAMVGWGCEDAGREILDVMDWNMDFMAIQKWGCFTDCWIR
jgi:hypothetical protein